MIDGKKEQCGLLGVYGFEDASKLIYNGLFSLQHRGQEGAGIVTSDLKHVKIFKGLGLVSNIFTPDILDELSGVCGIGHVRYSTTGSPRIPNVQPLVIECVDGVWTVAHNGNLVNALELRSRYQENGAIFQTSTDSEIFIHLLADPTLRKKTDRVAQALSQLQGAFSFLIMNKDSLMAARDPWGFRPLSIGKIASTYIFASESCALSQVGAEYVRDVMPGELVVVNAGGMHSSFFCQTSKKLSQCIFEIIYFARPNSCVFGYNVHQIRLQYGIRLAKEYPVKADVVIPIPDSGNSAAMGYARESDIPLDMGFIRNHYIGRTFIMPHMGLRSVSADMKLSVMPEVVRGKRVIVVDDSIVRGNTIQKRVRLLREAGAREVHVRVSCPPIKFPCFFGIDFSTKKELIAGQRSINEICSFIGADTLGYLSIDGLLAPLKNCENFCTACFTGEYPIEPESTTRKQMFESDILQLFE